MSAVGRLPLKWIAIFTVAVNLLMIVPPLHMLQVYDRVLTSNSLETLIYITLIAVAALVLYGVAETVRGKLAHRASAQYTIALSDPIFSKLSRNKNAAGGATQVLRDFNSVRSFISSRALMGLFDLPFAPFFIFLMFLLHWSLGVLTLIGLVALLAVALLNKTLTASNSAASKKSDMEALTLRADRFHASRRHSRHGPAAGDHDPLGKPDGRCAAGGRRGGQPDGNVLRYFQVGAKNRADRDHGMGRLIWRSEVTYQPVSSLRLRC